MVLFDELVEQHRVHCVVAHGVNPSIDVPGHQVRVHLLHVLRDQAKLRRAFGVDLVLVMESHRLQRENSLARAVHRFDLILETS